MPRFELWHTHTERYWACATPAQVLAVLAHYKEIRDEITVTEYDHDCATCTNATDWLTINTTGYVSPTEHPEFYPCTMDWAELHVDMEPA